jgi:hypothetical protein
MAVGGYELEQDEDIDLRLKGKMVTRCYIDAAFSLEFWEKGFLTVIRISSLMSIEKGELLLKLSAGKTAEAAQATMLWGKKVEHAVGRKDGSLDIGFVDGTKLRVPIDPDYEAWDLRGEKGFIVVSRPGGGLAIWLPK